MTQRPTSSATHQDGVAGPSVVWLAIGFLLAGLGTVMLGPLMPTLLHDWRLSDQQGGLLLAAKFVGSFLGGVSVPRRLRLGVPRRPWCLRPPVWRIRAEQWPN